MDEDWTGVYIAVGGSVRFETHSLTAGADTILQVFAWDGVTKGAELGTSNDVGGPWWWPESKRSRVDLQIEDDSAFLIRVSNDSASSIYTTSHEFPGYTLELSYL